MTTSSITPGSRLSWRLPSVSTRASTRPRTLGEHLIWVRAGSSTSRPAGSEVIGKALAIHDLCRNRDVPVWCGGMLESGIGRLHNVALASLPGFTLPGDTSASSRYFAEDIIDPPVTAPEGMVTVPDEPGIGHRVRTGLIERLTVAEEQILPGTGSG